MPQRQRAVSTQVNKMMEQKDIFDRLMSLKLLRCLEPFYKRHKEVLLYLFFGGCAVVLNVALYVGLNKCLKLNALITNVIAWVICILFQFFTNRTWVFKEQATRSTANLLRQMLAFFTGRIFTLLVEEVILAVFIVWLGWPGLPVKLSAQGLVIALNYIISKRMILRKRRRELKIRMKGEDKKRVAPVVVDYSQLVCGPFTSGRTHG